jgi:hypothetical protein
VELPPTLNLGDLDANILGALDDTLALAFRQDAQKGDEPPSDGRGKIQAVPALVELTGAAR